MTDPPRCPVMDFDHHSSEHAADPVAGYRAVREQGGRGWTTAHGGFWVIADYESVFEAARDDDLFSSSRSEHGGDGLNVVIPKTPMHEHLPIEVDPPRFRDYRRLINPLTAPKAVQRLRPRVERHVDDFIDTIIESGEGDFTAVIGVPAIVTIEWLGLPLEDWRLYASAHHQHVAGLPGSPEYTEAMETHFPYLTERMWATIRARFAEPTDDVITYLTQQEVGGRAITEDEVFGLVDLLVSGGVATTASLVSQTLVWLGQHPDQRQRLIDDPQLMDHALEEFLRYFSPTQALARTVTRDSDFQGCPMREGDRVLLSWASANRDENAFKAPEILDIERWPNRHAAFGIGIHRCAGSHLARLMARTMIRSVIVRMPDYVVDTDSLRRYRDQGTNVGFRSIPVTFTPGSRMYDAPANTADSAG